MEDSFNILQTDTVDTMPLIGGRLEPFALECVAQMRPTGRAPDLDPISIGIGKLRNSPGNAVVKGWPPTTAVELRGGGVQGGAATLTVEAPRGWILAPLLHQQLVLELTWKKTERLG
jgi:hypothetical protein